MDPITKITDTLKSAFSTIADLSTSKSDIVKALNMGFRDVYLAGIQPRLVHVSIGFGNAKYKHSMSSNRFRSGLILTIQNDDRLLKSEVSDIANVVLYNPVHIRIFMSAGFDTVIVKGRNTEGLMWPIRE